MKRFLIGCLVVLAAEMALAAELLTTFVGAESGESAPVRLENRAANTARVLVRNAAAIAFEGGRLYRFARSIVGCHFVYPVDQWYVG